jgi:DNA-binding transcriptional ArsR family regulator
MALRKDNYEGLAGVFLALSDEIRLTILSLLAKKEMNVLAIQEKLQLPQSTTSYNLGLLYSGGLVTRRREGKGSAYSIADLTEHSLGRKSKSTTPDSNAARFGPVELTLPRETAKSDKLEELTMIFRSLSNETRLRIVALLGKGEQHVAAIGDKLKLPQSSVSNHLGRLRLGGLVVRRREHKRVFYSLADLSKHRLGRKPKTTLPNINAARFGPVELVIPKK